MARPRRGTAPGLGEFLNTLETRLRILSVQEVLAALVAHAERLPSGRRQAFLDIFPDPRVTPSGAVEPEDHLLLADVDAFVARARAGEFDQEETWYDVRYDDDDWDYDGADTSWVPEADALFAAAGEAFVGERLALAREAYGRLVRLFAPIEQGGSDLGEWDLDSTDIGEAVARYLRAVYETTPPGERASALYREYTTLGVGANPDLLHAIATTRRGDLPDLEVFLPAWIEALLAETTALSPARRQRLLTEATLLHRGLDGLADLARRPGSHRPGTYLAWVDALADAGRDADAADAAREALALANTTATALAQAADRLAGLTTRLGDSAAAVAARSTAWRAEPTRQRLLALVATGEAAGTLATTLATEARSAASGRDDRLSCDLLLLAGKVDAAAAVLTRAAPLGWSRSAHPGPVVLPYLLVAATGAAPPPAEESHLGRAFAAIDDDPLLPDVGDPHLGDRYDEVDAYDGRDGWRTGLRPDDDRPDGPATPLTALLSRGILQHPGTPAQRRRWLVAAATAIEQRVDAIVSNKHRSAYPKAASLVVAHAEALIITGTADAHEYIAEVQRTYPRHVAFRAALNDAAATSALLIGTTHGGPPAPSRTARRVRVPGAELPAAGRTPRGS
jgi:hypothetical protein